MRYTGKIEMTFEFAVPGDNPDDDCETRNADTAIAAAAVVAQLVERITTKEMAEYLVRFDHPEVQSFAIPHEDDPAVD